MATPNLKIAEEISINTTTGVLLIDGEPFGYYLAKEPVEISIPGPHDISKVTITILTDHVTVAPKPDAIRANTKT